MVTDHELFIVSDLVTAFMYAVSYCAEDIYRGEVLLPEDKQVLFHLFFSCRIRG